MQGKIDAKYDARKRMAAFSDRLERALKDHPDVPDGLGKQKWIRDGLRAKYGIEVSAQSVSKWLKGSDGGSRPRDVLVPLANLLGVDPGWLATGFKNQEVADTPVHPAHLGKPVPSVDPVPAPQPAAKPAPAVEPKSAPTQSAGDQDLASFQRGARNLVAGMVQMAGGTVAFPQGELADMLAFLDGKSLMVNVIPGVQLNRSNYRFEVPNSAMSDATNLGVIKGEHPFDTKIFHLDTAMIRKCGEQSGGKWIVLVERSYSGFSLDGKRLNEITDIRVLNA